MRWHALFCDLESQLDAAEGAEFVAEVVDRTRLEQARLRLVDRLRGALGGGVSVWLAGGASLRGSLLDVGRDWLLLAEERGGEALVATAAVTSLSGLAFASATPGAEGVVERRLDLRHALRGIARSRTPVAVLSRDGSILTGTLDRVGADFVELAEHSPGEPRRMRSVAGVRLVPLATLAAVRSI